MHAMYTLFLLNKSRYAVHCSTRLHPTKIKDNDHNMPTNATSPTCIAQYILKTQN